MAAPFAALEARVNAAVFAHLANATADFGGGVVVDGVFQSGYVSTLGVESTGPRFECRAAALPVGYRSAPFVINGTSYLVTEAHPDETGVTVLLLGKA